MFHNIGVILVSPKVGCCLAQKLDDGLIMAAVVIAVVGCSDSVQCSKHRQRVETRLCATL